MTSAENTTNPAAQSDASRATVPIGAWRSALTSPTLVNRIALGLGALSLIKLIMLVGLRKELFEIHYRVSGLPPTWVNSAAFYLFALLAGLNIWKLGARCMPAGVRIVRSANAAMLFLAAVFILFTFHAGDRNYLNAVMTEMLHFKDLRWNLSLSLFFAMPFLFVWMFIYALIYYGLWRKGCEHFILRVTAVFATLYIALCLDDFSQYRDALLVADCIGIACLVLNGGKLNPIWMALPLIGAGSFFVLFHGYERRLSPQYFSPEFAVLLWGYLILLTGLTLIAWRRGFLAGWWRILPFAVTVFLFINVNFPSAPNYENALTVGFMFPRYFIDEIRIMIVLWLIGAAYRKLRPGGRLWWLDIINLLLITVALADLRLTQVLGVRMDWDVISLAAGETTKMMWRMAQPYLASLTLGLAVITILYVSSLRLLKRLQKTVTHQETASPNGRSFAYAAVACVLLGMAGVLFTPGDRAAGETLVLFAKSSPYFRRVAMPVMDRAAFLQTVKDLGLSDMVAPPASVPARAPRDLNVIVIFQESTYNKHLSLFGSKEDTQPLLSHYQDRMELFPNFFSVFAGSINARFGTFTGLYPVKDFHAFTAERVPVKSIFEILHEHDYTCSMFYSSHFFYTDFGDLLRNRGLDTMYDADTMPGASTNKQVSWGLQEDATLNAMREQIKQYAAGQKKFFLTYVPAAPHNPFDGTPDRFRKNRRADKFGDLTPFYVNELLYMDWTITSIIDQLKESGLLDKTLVVITADHGEMLGDNGGPVGHGWALTPELANVPLIIMDPGHPGRHVNNTIGSQVDLLPTILDSLGIPLPPGELYQGASLYSQSLNTNRVLYLNTMQEYGEIKGSQFVRGNRNPDGEDRADTRQVFNISDEGMRTVFVSEEAPATNAPSISDFDKFQRNFLRNYSDYRRMFRPTEPAR
jgi:hypothetical protein